MDEAGHSGDSAASRSTSGGDSRDRALTNGWATSDSPWSNAGAALDPEDDDIAPWRRPAEVRPFARRTGEFASPRGTDDVLRGYTAEYPPPADHLQPADFPPPAAFPPAAFPPPTGQMPADQMPGDRARVNQVPADQVPAESPEDTPSRPSRFSDFLSRFPTSGGRGPGAPGPAAPIDPAPQPWSEPARPQAPQPAAPPPGSRSAEGFRPVNAPTSGFRANDLPPPGPGPALDPAGVDRRLGHMRNVDAPPPSSAPPYPYEGDLDDARREPSRPVGQQRTAVPLVRPSRGAEIADIGQRDHPSPPIGRRPDWNAPEFARHARDPNGQGEGMPRVGSPPAPPAPATPDAVQPRPSYDPSSYPRRLPYEGPFAGDPTDRSVEEAGTGLPQRVPAEPDVPTVPEPPSVEPTAETPQLARIATHLRNGELLPAEQRQEGFDVTAILAAVREVDGVRDAKLRATPQGAHSLRLDLAEGADPAEVSRQVARLLQDRMGLDAAMKGAAGMPPSSNGVAAGPPPPPIPAAEQAAPFPAAEQPAPFPAAEQAAPFPAAEQTAAMPTAPGHAAMQNAPAAAMPTMMPGPIPRVATGRAPVSGGPSGAAETQVIPTQTPLPLPPRSRPGRATPAPGNAPISAPAVAPVSAPTGGKPQYVPGPSTSAETVPLGGELGGPRPLHVGESPGPRAVIENVQVTTSGIKANVEVHLSAGDRTATGTATGPSLDGYLLRLCAMAAADAIDGMLATSEHADGPPRCHIHHAAVVPFGSVQVAVVVVLLSCGSWVDQLAGSAVVTGDDGRAMVQATLAAVNRRLEALLS